MNTTETICRWSYDAGDDAWDTDCGRRFTLSNGTPTENGMAFCCYCGHQLPHRTATEGQ